MADPLQSRLDAEQKAAYEQQRSDDLEILRSTVVVPRFDDADDSAEDEDDDSDESAGEYADMDEEEREGSTFLDYLFMASPLTWLSRYLLK